MADRGAPAADLKGQHDPRFRAALDLWLAEDEKTAPPEFTALAAEGNRAAQVLLAHIDITVPLQGPWLASLPRADRVALMRRPGGLSGKSWMAAAADDTPLAAAWSAPSSAGDRDELEIARAFAALGEERAVRMALAAKSHHGRGFAAMADDPMFRPASRWSPPRSLRAPRRPPDRPSFRSRSQPVADGPAASLDHHFLRQQRSLRQRPTGLNHGQSPPTITARTRA